MTTADPDLPPYDNRRILAASFPERVRLACRTWAAQINPNQRVVIALYWTKYIFGFIGGWAVFVSLSADYPGFGSPLSWAFMKVAFQKAILWAMFYELCGFGCSWGPMNARFSPMTLGLRHFLRPGTTKLALFPKLPIIGGHQRSLLDVWLYAANQIFILYALIQPEITTELLLPMIVLVPVLGVLDKTLFLAARSEHYYVALVCLTFAMGDDLWISACKIVWCAVWFWAATSKVNHHFPSVIMFMMNNGPFFPSFLKKPLFVSYPDDLRPSKMASAMAHMGTMTEYAIPILLLTSSNSPILTALILCLMASFHGFIAFNCPNGMPIEWNILMVYGGIFLFGFHPEASVLAVGSMPMLVGFLFLSLFVLQLYGNFFPKHVSFLLSMRYYAGNWAYNVWLFRGQSVEKLKKLRMASGTMREQLTKVMPDADKDTIDAALAMMMSSRFMHLEGRPLFEALPRAVDHIDNYEWHEGELVGGQIIGWNFGDGHLNGRCLLEAIQPQCEFEAGELRVVSVESQPLFGGTMEWKVWDAKTGLVDEGTTIMAPMRALQPWPMGEYAEALTRGRAGEVG